MGGSSVFSQTIIYYRKIRRIALKEKCWKFVIFAVIISLLVASVVGKDMFSNFDNTKSGFFTIASSAIWIGIFNSIQSICKEHAIIRNEYRSGMKMSAYIAANTIWQMVLCIIQSLVLILICMCFIDFNKKGILIPKAMVEYYITVFLIMFGSDIMGIMISSIAGNSTTAMTIMPFVLILQLVMSGVLFDLSGWSEKVSYITFSKWGMSAFGSIANINDVKAFPLAISKAFPVVQRLELDSCYDHTRANLIKSWLCCVGIGAFCYTASIISLKIKNHDS